jgi:hypothetical protein
MLSLRAILWAVGMSLAGALIGLIAGRSILVVNLDYILPCAAIGCGIGFLLGMWLDAFLPKKNNSN